MIHDTQIYKELHLLLTLAFKYQFLLTGPFLVSPSTDVTQIDNNIFKQLGFQFLESKTLEFDGGIELEFGLAGEPKKALDLIATSDKFFISLYNYHSQIPINEIRFSNLRECQLMGVLKQQGSLLAPPLLNIQSARGVMTQFVSSTNVEKIRVVVALNEQS
jgi:hypothetical protein